MKVGGVTLFAVFFVAGTAAAATSPPTWTARQMGAAARATGYTHKTAACRRSGPGFRCKTGTRTFYMAPAAMGGWVCAGATRRTCRPQRKGFLTPAQSTRLGGLLAASGYAANGYVQQHYKGVPLTTAGSCSPFGTNRYTCPYSSPSVTVTVTYKPTRGGWVITATAASG